MPAVAPLRLAASRWAAAAIGLLLFARVDVASAETPIYKCSQPNGSTLYSEYPCEGGARVEVHPGAADPRAVARLAQARAELDRSAARRHAQLEREAARRADVARTQAEMAAFQSAPDPIVAYPDVAYGPVYGGYYGKGPHVRYPRARPFGRLDAHRDSIGAAGARFRVHVGRVPATPANPARSR